MHIGSSRGTFISVPDDDVAELKGMFQRLPEAAAISQ
jgi:hypothetical protein